MKKTLSHLLPELATALCLGLLVAVPRHAAASGTPPSGRVVSVGQDSGGLYLSLPGIQDASYSIEVKNALTNTIWERLGSVTGLDGPTVYPLPPDSSPSRFFHVLFPQPLVTAGEPAYLAGTGGETLYVTGQFFYPGDEVRVNGILLENITYISPTLLSATLPPQTPGLYDLEVVSGQTGARLAFLPAALEVSPPVVRTLQEPPEWPPAGPSPSLKKEFKGHVTLLKAFDDDEPSASARHTKTGHVTILKAFDDEGPSALLAAFLSKKGYDYYQAQSALSARGHTKTGHVTILKAFDDEGSSALLAAFLSKKGYDYYQAQSALSARGHTKTGHVTILKAFDDEGSSALIAAFLSKKGYDYYQAQSALSARGHTKTGHVTLLKAFDDGAPELRLHSGEVQVQVTDLEVAGRGLDFAWVRTYRSRTGTNTTQGVRWTHAYDLSIQPLGGDILVHDGTGRTDTYRLQADGTYACPELFREGTLTNEVFRLTFADTGFWEFNPLSAGSAAGKIARIEDRNGNALTFIYNGDLLSQVIDTLGRTNTLAYTAEGRVASVTDCTGRTVTYAYYAGEPGGSTGDLKSVTSPPVTGTPNGNDFPEGKTVTYTYSEGYANEAENHLLLSVIDAQSQIVYRHVYQHNQTDLSFLRCVSVQHGSDPAACITYLPQTPAPNNRFAAMRCIVNDPAGNVTESFFDLRNRCVTQREFTGRAVAGTPVTDTENRPTGKLRQTDPDVYETQVSWNNDSLCTRIALPSGLTGTFVHGGDANTLCRMRKRPDLLYQAWDAKATGGADTDGDGAPDLFKIETSYTYDPRFSSDPTVPDNLRTRINQLEAQLKNLGLLSFVAGDNTPIVRGSAMGGLARIKPKGWNGTVKGVAFDGRDDDCDGFATSATDPRGTTTTAEYDARGNCTRIVTPFTSVTDTYTQTSQWDIAYDTYGQINAITSAPDAAGRRRVTSFGWQLGHLHEVVDDAAPGGLAITATVERDARGNITRAIDPDGPDTLYAYNALDQLVSRSSPPFGDGSGQRVTTTFFYDLNDNITRVDTDNRQENGAPVADNPAWTTRFDYDALNRCVAVATEVDAATAVTNRFEYDANGQLAAHLPPLAASGAEPANRTDYAYDERGLLFRATRAPGTADAATTEYAYTGDCAPASRKYVGELDATYDYDGFGRAKSATDAGGNNENWCFDGAGALTVRRTTGETPDLPGSAGNRRLAETRWTYDGLGRCTAQIDSFFDIFTELAIDDGARTTSFAYAPNGQLTCVTNDLGQGTSYAYDTAGRLASVSQPGSTRQCTCTPGYLITCITQTDSPDLGGQAQTFVTDFAYDALGRMTASWDTTGNTNRWYYDSLGRVVRTTDPRGNEQRSRYDGRGLLTGAISYVGPCDADSSGVDRGITINTTHVEYDTQGRVAAVIDVNTNTTVYTYDVRNRLASVTSPDGTARHLVWSPRSNLTQETDANGTTIDYSYDPLNRLIRKDVTCGAGVEPTTTFETFAYDGLSRLVAASNDVSSSEFAYDSLGNTVQTVQDGLAITYACDSLGNARTCTCPSGYSVHRTFNGNNEVATVSVEAGGLVSPVASFSYDGPGRLARISRPNLTFSYILWNGLASSPNPAGDYGSRQVAAVSHTTSGGSVIDERVFAYDHAQNKTLRAQTEPFTLAGETTTNAWDHDALNRTRLAIKTKGTSAQRLAYVLDGKGSRIAVTNDASPEFYTRDATLPDPGDFQMDQYTETPFGAQTYDASGNMLSRASPAEQWFYHYDYDGRLVQVDGPDALGGISPVAAFGYDALGRRVAKTTFPSGLPPEVTQYVYGGDVDEDCDGTSDDVIETRKGAAVSSVSVLAGSGSGAAAASYAATGRMLSPPLAVISGAGEVLFMHTDDLGSVLALTDAAGNVIERCDYDDFGAPTFLAADGTPLTDAVGLPATSSPAGNPYLFSGMRWDGETGLYIDGTPKTPNYVDAKTGQYTSPGKRHAWGLGGNTSLRAFANNSPWTLRKEEGGRHTPFHNRRELTTRFENGDIPTQDEFGSLIDSIFILEAVKRIGGSGIN